MEYENNDPEGRDPIPPDMYADIVASFFDVHELWLPRDDIDKLDIFSLHTLAPRNRESVREYARLVERAAVLRCARVICMIRSGQNVTFHTLNGAPDASA